MDWLNVAMALDWDRPLPWYLALPVSLVFVAVWVLLGLGILDKVARILHWRR